jgi:enamine deaminase RidA (YjgF/YER057c/UK114 family)
VTLQAILPPGWKRPRGYANGMVGEGRVLLVAGQIGWDEGEKLVSSELHLQWDRALANVLAVVQAAGGGPEHVARMTVFVTDRDAYLAQAKQIGEHWRARMGAHYPAMSLLQVAALLEEGAQVEIEATAILPRRGDDR